MVRSTPVDVNPLLPGGHGKPEPASVTSTSWRCALRPICRARLGHSSHRLAAALRIVRAKAQRALDSTRLSTVNRKAIGSNGFSMTRSETRARNARASALVAPAVRKMTFAACDGEMRSSSACKLTARVYRTSPLTRARSACASNGFSIRWFVLESRNSRAREVNAPPVMNTNLRPSSGSIFTASS